MTFLRSRSRSTLLRAGVASVALAVTGVALAPRAPQASSRLALAPCEEPQVCFSFDTIDQGQFSGFGAFCAAPSGPAPDARPCDPSDTAPACYACVARPAFEAVIRSECAWIDFWEQHAGEQFPVPPPPAVDFELHAVVAVVSGARPDGCFGIEIASITGTQRCRTRTIHVRERVPCPQEPCPDVVTNNYHFVQVCRELLPPGIPIAFEHRRRDVPCTAEIACSVR